MIRKALADRGVRTVESGVDPRIVPIEDQQFGDEGIDDVRSDGVQEQKSAARSAAAERVRRRSGYSD
jgi:hypothetical protein